MFEDHVSASTPTQLAVTQQPSTTANAGLAFATQPKVTVQDVYGNTASSNAVITVMKRLAVTNGTTTAQTATVASGVANVSA